MENNKTVTINITSLLGVAFIILKLCHVIDWRWLWVLAPFWIPLAIWLVAMAITLGIAGILMWIEE